MKKKKTPEACVPHVAGVQGRENDTVEGDPLPNSDSKISLPAEELSLARIGLYGKPFRTELRVLVLPRSPGRLARVRPLCEVLQAKGVTLNSCIAQAMRLEVPLPSPPTW